MPRTFAAGAVLFAALMISACAGPAVEPAEPSSAPPASASVVRPSAPGVAQSPRPSPAATMPTGFLPLPFGCSPAKARCQDLPAGTYVTTGEFAFMTGFMVTLPAGWSSPEQAAGEFSLHAAGDTNRNNNLFFWRDIAAADSTGQAIAGVGGTPTDLAAFIANDPRLIVTERGTATIGDGVSAISMVISVNPAGPMDDPEGCPGDSCANFLVDPFYWDGALGITVNSFEDPSLACPCSHAMRLYLASVGGPARTHTLAVAVLAYGPNGGPGLAAFEAAVAPIIASIRLPAPVAP